MHCLTCLDIFEPIDVRLDFGICHHRDRIPAIQPGICRKLGLRLINHSILKMIAKIAVDVECKIQYGCAFVNKHGGSVPAEYLDFFVIGVTG